MAPKAPNPITFHDLVIMGLIGLIGLLMVLVYGQGRIVKAVENIEEIARQEAEVRAR